VINIEPLRVERGTMLSCGDPSDAESQVVLRFQFHSLVIQQGSQRLTNVSESEKSEFVMGHNFSNIW
jgi:hypothetical protein